MSFVHLIVGLGNPGQEYEQTRHNVGFWAVDALVQHLGCQWTENKKVKGLLASHKEAGQTFYFLKPQTYMNLSGESVQACISFFKLDYTHLLVCHDQMDLQPGILRLKLNGGTSGHNGLKSIVSSLGGHTDFYRLAIGIGHPGDKNRVVGFVLEKPPSAEYTLIESSITRIVENERLLRSGPFTQIQKEINTNNS